MARGLVLLVSLAAAVGLARPAMAQQVGDPFPFITAGNSATVLLLGSCDDNGLGGDRYAAYKMGGASVLAAASPGGAPLASVPLPAGNLSAEQLVAYCPSLIVPGPPPGTYWVVMVYGLTNQTSAPASAWKQVVVGSRNCTSPPLPPVHSSGSPQVTGSTLTLAFSGAAQGCAIDRIDLEVGTTPGGSDVGIFPLPGLNTFFPNVPSGAYFTRARGVNAYGRSNPSVETPLQFPGPCAVGSVPTPVNPSVAVNGSQVTISWTLSPATGATFHQITLLEPTSFFVTNNIVLPGAATSVSVPGVPPGAYRIRVSAGNACGIRAMVPLSYIDFTVP